MGWGNKWTIPNEIAFIMTDRLTPITPKEFKEMHEQQWPTSYDSGITPELIGVEPNTEQLIKAYATVRNRKPTHDPYTNPNAHIYYECVCGAILDPQTKSFAALNNHASDKGWKIRFTDKGYVPYCVKCGEEME